MSTPEDRERRVDEAIAAYLQALEAGAAPEREAFLAAHPDLRAELASFLDAREVLRRRAPAGPDATLGADPPNAAPLGSVSYFGDYQLLREVARGGMGVVFEARQASLNRVVALKMILAGNLAAEQDVARFRAEAEAVANLDHPNVCPVYEVGEHNGQHYYAMKFLVAGSLAGRVRQLVRQPRQAAELLAKVADAVQHAHQRGILHRDLKPANVLLDEDGNPYVADFGLAKRVGGDGLTQTGAIVGTPAYVAPEQARARKDLTTAVDVYSLGAILYECLTGQPPFSGASPMEVLQQVTDRPPIPPRQLESSVPRDLETIALKCLEKEPTRRYQSAAAFADDLRRWLANRPIEARPTGSPERVWRWCQRNPVVAALLMTTLLTFLVGFAGTIHFGLRADAQARNAIRAGEEKDAALSQEANARREARWQLARQYVSRGWAELEKGDVLSALPWYVEALALEDDDPVRAEVHRRRLGELLRYCPRMKHVLVHEGHVNHAQLSGDGRYVLTVERLDDKMHGRFWDAATGELISGPWECIGGEVEFSPDNRAVAFVSSESEVREVPSGRLRAKVLPSHECYAATWHPSGRSLLVRYRRNWGDRRTLAARLIDSSTGEPLAAEITAKEHPVYWGRFSPDGKVLATIVEHDTGAAYLYDSSISRYDVEDLGPTWRGKTSTQFRDPTTGKVLAELPSDDVTRLEFNPQGGTFATIHKTGTVRWWDVTTRKSLGSSETDHATRLAWSADGKALLASTFLWHAEPTWIEPGPSGGATRAATDRIVPDWPRAPGRMVLCKGDSGVDLWHPGRVGHAEEALRAIRCPSSPSFAQLGPDGRTLLTAGSSARLVHLWDVGVRSCDRSTLDRVVSQARYEVRQTYPAIPNTDSVRFSFIDYHQDREPVGKPLDFATYVASLLSADQKRWFIIRRLEGDTWELRCYDVPSLRERFAPVSLGKLAEWPRQVEDESSGRLALICTVPGEGANRTEVRLFDDGKLLGAGDVGPILATGPNSNDRGLRFSADGGTLAAVWHNDKDSKHEAYCRAWSLPDFTPRFDPMRLDGTDVWVGQTSHDGRYLPVSFYQRTGDRTGRVIDLKEASVVGRTPEGIWPIAFLSGGRLLVESGSGRRVWDLERGTAASLLMKDLELLEAPAPGRSDVLRGYSYAYGTRRPLAYDARTGESITVPNSLGGNFRDSYPIEKRSVEQLRLLAAVLTGRRLDAVGEVVPLESAEYVAAWKRLCQEVPDARHLTAEEELDWHRDEASVAETWRDWQAAEAHLRWLVEHSPEDAEWRARWAEVLAELGRWTDARREYQEAAKRLPGAMPARVRAAWAWDANGDAVTRLTYAFHARANAAWAALAAGDREQYRRDVAALLREYQKTGSSARGTELLRLAAMGDDAAAAKQALAIDVGGDEHWAGLAKARAEGRALVSPEAVTKELGEGWRDRLIARLLAAK